jgi:hypothetical protein
MDAGSGRAVVKVAKGLVSGDSTVRSNSRQASLSYNATAPLALRSLRRPATRARRLPRLRAVVSSTSTGCREPSVPARVPGP